MADQDSLSIEINLKLPTYVFQLQNPELQHLHQEASKALWEGIEKDEMAPFLNTLPSSLTDSFPPSTSSSSLLTTLQTKNTETLADFDKKIKEAEDSLGDIDVSEPLRERAGYLCRIGDKANALPALHLASTKTAGIGARIDLVLAKIRLGMFYGDGEEVEKGLGEAKELIDQGGDWDRRNRLKLYSAISHIQHRQFQLASGLLVDSLSTFTATELMEYEEFVGLCVLIAGVGLDRKGVKEKILASAEINSLMPQLPSLTLLTKSLYECDYSSFFLALSQVEEQYLLPSPLLAPHARYYVKEMRIKAYTQILESYRSLTIERMSKAFGVSVSFLDADLAKFISSGRLACTIDKVSGVITTDKTSAENKTAAYEQVVKQGDLLLNEIQKLSRVIG